MKNIKAQLAIGLVCVVLGLVLALQFKTVQNNYLGGAAPAQKAQELAAELKKVREEKEALMSEVNALEGKIKEIEEAESKENVLVKNMSAELEKYKIISGLRKVKGPGVVVVVDDPPIDPEYSSDVSIIMYNYDLLLSLINKLNDAGAEAISINEQRYVSRTEISLAGSNVNINSVPTAPPFVIKAIGNPDTLESALNIRFGIVDQMKSERYNLQVSVKKQDEIIIPRYNEIIKFRYAKPVEDMEQ
ncbi:DUF881 domain-containing protein [Crassaminicella thermophila]|uniref:DUF881 domain-containing protein n=1 Tax=Crassaminicella thermophila TaxID=2599308 RepID=A0A5C0SDW6_CRATE|nr:DUF881 domain-containing protein [Crassaminicella thermophila]QEK11956.1 DUF881 domain-containing protein [Crassaminicella thermophila]